MIFHPICWPFFLPTRLDDQAPRFAGVKEWFFSKWRGARVWLDRQQDFGFKKKNVFQALLGFLGLGNLDSFSLGEYLVYLQSHQKSFKISSDPLKRIWIRGSKLIAPLSKLYK